MGLVRKFRKAKELPDSRNIESLEFEVGLLLPTLVRSEWKILSFEVILIFQNFHFVGEVGAVSYQNASNVGKTKELLK